MKAVRINGKVVGYVGKNKHGLWRATDSKRRRVQPYLLSRKVAVRRLIAHTYDIDGFLTKQTQQAIARMDKKRIK
jgi:hypothetical protein